jgi:ATP-dependent Clp protease ATP-binding subunit ClpA
MFSTELGLTLEAAFREAASRRHVFFCLEHLLYALTYDEQIIEILQKVGAQIATLRKDLEQFFEVHTHGLHRLFGYIEQI